MLIVWQAVAFTACVLFGLLPSTEVECRFEAPVVEIAPAPSPVVAPKPVEPPAKSPPPAATSADPASGTAEHRRD